MKSYHIMENGCVVGTAEVETEGLYLNIRARCSPLDMQMYRLILSRDSKRIDLGVCVPEKDSYVVNKRIQRKLIGEGTLLFALEAKESAEHTQFIPLDSEKPFQYLDRLSSGYLASRNGVSGVVLVR